MRTTTFAEDILEEIDRVERAFLDREPVVRAFLPEEHRFERLRGDAERLATVSKSAHPEDVRPAVLLGIKDIFHVDGFPTRAGSQLPPEMLAGAQASSVSRLKAKGALIVGKTVTTEFAYFAPGPTRNPHNPNHTPGGSSSGSAAGVAAGMCHAALGTQTIGSIIRPAAFCGVVGFKPTFGRIATDGVIPLSPSLDHVGIFARDTRTAGELAESLLTDPMPREPMPARPVLGVPEGPYLNSATARGLKNFDLACEHLQAAGYKIVRLPVMEDFDAIKARHQLILAAEAARVHAPWFTRYADRYADKTADLIRRGKGISDGELAGALGAMEAWRASFDAMMALSGVDLWISPAAPGTAPEGLGSTGDPVMNLPWTQAGLPAISIPSGEDADGLPFGLQVSGRRNSDETLLVWATEMEKVVRHA